ncbi:MAG: DUF3987 domain-containing protein [Erythrobacter sp.]|uniref:DUF3987 domain-containing protein n=1 Tax=Erythrobacter sp. TaxID=1042 RepID=UPI0026098105|nr:DUF3987 domain-containing protein [Erythrobacter sp.]MDJ0977654.1 DUF3987 domain-containing protein [Erythrobacter sp.]
MVDLRFLHEKTPAEIAAEVQQEEAKLVRAALAQQSSTQKAHATGNPLNADCQLAFPPGFTGLIARFVYDQAPRPVAEVAIVAALGAMAGIAGRSWCISDTGLNLFVILVARSAIGKEAMHSGITMLVRAASSQYPQVANAFDFSDYASGPALVKACAQRPCFVNVSSEIGHKFLAMAKDREQAVRSYRKALTDLYSKSGPHSIAGGITYSNRDENAASVHGVAFSLIGETTPTNFYESITSAMMGDGFMSRFCVIDYTGERPEENRERLKEPHPELVAHFVEIARQADLLSSKENFMQVIVDTNAQTLLDQFSLECDQHIRAAGDDEGRRQLWNRAHLKVLRVSALLAVSDYPAAPTVNLKQVEWAITLIRHGISAFEHRIRAGDVGEGTDGGREQKVLDLCKEFLFLPAGKIPGWLKHAGKMQQAAIIPRKYLQQRTQRLAAFEKHRLGHTAALNLAIKTAITNGNLMEVNKSKAAELYGYSGQAYRLLSSN